MSSNNTPADNKPAKRADIQGIRALAVILVITQHFWNLPEGGFIGVDIFFVLSGFLITGIILRDITTYGKIRLPRFYARRLRRITPVALFVSLVSIVFAWTTWFTPQALQYTLDGIWSNLWVANWHFAGTGIDYLAHSASPSPFQHYWSLSVEEQFYLAWPLLLELAWFIGNRKGKGERWLDIIIIATIFFSALWAIAFTVYRGQWAYFDTISRACEFALGALAGRLVLKRQFGAIYGIIGLIGLIASAFLIKAISPFPGPWALLPSINTALVLLCHQQNIVVKSVLENPISCWLGNISYSLYLWHFPVLIFASTWFETTNLVLVVALIVTVLLSALSYYFVENPIRYSKLLRSWEKPSINEPSSNWMRRGNFASLGILFCVFAMLVWQFAPSKFGVLAPQTMSVQRAKATLTYNSFEKVQEAIGQSESETWNTNLIPSPDELTQYQLGQAMSPDTTCTVGAGSTNLKYCHWGAATDIASKKILVIGDSVAMAWTPAIIASSNENTHIIAAGVGSCSIMSISQEADFATNGFSEKCIATREALFKLVEDTKPDTVVIASATGGYNYQLNADGQIISDDASKQENWYQGTETTLNRIAQSTSKIVVIGSPGLTGDPRSCMTKTNSISDCTAVLTDYQQAKEKAEAQAVADFNATGVEVTRFDALAVTCLNGKCPVVIGNYITHTDPTHITQAFAESLAPLIKDML